MALAGAFEADPNIPPEAGAAPPNMLFDDAGEAAAAPKGVLVGVLEPKENGAGEGEDLVSVLPKLKAGAGVDADGVVPKLNPPGAADGVEGLLAAAPNRFEGGAAAGVVEAVLDEPNKLVGAEALACSFGAEDPKAKGDEGAGVAASLLDPNVKEELGFVDELPNAKGVEAAAAAGVVDLDPPNKGFVEEFAGLFDPKRPPVGVAAEAAGWLVPKVNNGAAAGLSAGLS